MTKCRCVCTDAALSSINAFSNAINLEALNLNGVSTLTTIGNYSFYNAIKLTSLDLTDTSIRSIGQQAFGYAVHLASLYLPSTSLACNLIKSLARLLIHSLAPLPTHLLRPLLEKRFQVQRH